MKASEVDIRDRKIELQFCEWLCSFVDAHKLTPAEEILLLSNRIRYISESCIKGEREQVTNGTLQETSSN